MNGKVPEIEKMCSVCDVVDGTVQWSNYREQLMCLECEENDSYDG